MDYSQFINFFCIALEAALRLNISCRPALGDAGFAGEGRDVCVIFPMISVYHWGNHHLVFAGGFLLSLFCHALHRISFAIGSLEKNYCFV
jgi:hypothetical protein